MNQLITTTSFPLGQILITATAQEELDADDVAAAIRRRERGDWGDICPADTDANRRSLKQGGRLFSHYRDGNETPFYIITEADRRVTTVLLPADY